MPLPIKIHKEKQNIQTFLFFYFYVFLNLSICASSAVYPNFMHLWVSINSTLHQMDLECIPAFLSILYLFLSSMLYGIGKQPLCVYKTANIKAFMCCLYVDSLLCDRVANWTLICMNIFRIIMDYQTTSHEIFF